ncbi:hypothetical protein VitviT2T_006396 [Vitis vinifera]|uniref:50S ribosomal protein L33, chloroplastic n=1 Tax=Vitis vinifera TaxID=29760 RepID=A0ABY9BWL4_VITVI|nr:hypothetical protein VitviT2T_006396 [Vitis vinifera]
MGDKKKKAASIFIRLVSSAGTGFFYVKKKNPRKMLEKLEFRKYDPRSGNVFQTFPLKTLGIVGSEEEKTEQPSSDLIVEDLNDGLPGGPLPPSIIVNHAAAWAGYQSSLPRIRTRDLNPGSSPPGTICATSADAAWAGYQSSLPRIRTRDLNPGSSPPGTICASSTDGTRRTTARVKVPSSNPGEATLVSGPCGCPGPNKQMTSQQLQVD